MDSDTVENADRIVTIALLKSFRAAELFAASSVLGALIEATASTKAITELLASTVCLVGLASLYIGLRMRLDANLFEQWTQLDPRQLDDALKKINPGFEGDRKLELRLAGARTLFKRGTQLIALQAVLVLLMIWSCVQ